MGSSHSRLKNSNPRRSSKQTDKKKKKPKEICTIEDLFPSTSTSENIDENYKVSSSTSHEEYTIDQLYPRLKTPLLKTAVGTESCDGGPVSSYPTNSRRRGPLFIIDNFVGIDGFEYRRGSCRDVGKLKTIFKELKFTVDDGEGTAVNLGAKDMIGKCKSWAARDFSDIDCVVVVILTHSGDNGLLRGSDNKPVELSELISPFYADNSPTLIGKPKIFIIQACRGVTDSEGVEEKSDSITWTASNDRGGAEDGNRSEIIEGNAGEEGTNFKIESSGFLPRNADVVVAYSCSEGERAFRNTTSGSYYIKELTKVLESRCNKVKDKMHFTDILTEVQGVMSNLTIRRDNHNVTYVQMPEFRSTLRGPLYL